MRRRILAASAAALITASCAQANAATPTDPPPAAPPAAAGGLGPTLSAALLSGRDRARRDRAALRRQRARLKQAQRRAVPAVWVRLMRCEGGRYGWAADTGNGFYSGLQFTLGTYRSFGGVGWPQDQAPAYLVMIARRVLAVQGVGAWPVCGPAVGLTTSS